MTFRPPNIPAGLGTKDPKTQEDLRRIRDCLRNLSASMSDLQAQITAGFGGGGGTPDPHAASHENGGSDEVDLTGLSGVLANPQRADTIVESSGPTDLAVGAVADGEGLQRVGSTVVGYDLTALPYATPSIWSVPASPHAEDEEFNSSTLPSDFTLFGLTASTATATTPTSGVDPYTNPGAGVCRIDTNRATSRSWAALQPHCPPGAGTPVHWMYLKKITLSGTNGWVFRARIRTNTNTNVVVSANQSNMALIVAKDDGSGNKPAINAGAPFDAANSAWIGWEGDLGAMQLELYATSAGVLTSIFEAATVHMGTAAELEVVLILTSGSLSNTWYAFVRQPNYSYLFGTLTAANCGVKQGDTVWVGFDFQGITANTPVAPILSADYLRFEDTAANFIP